MASEPRPTAQSYSAQERAAIYRAIDERRDMRHFAGGQVAEDVLLRLLRAAHHAPNGTRSMHPQLFVRPEKFVAIEMDHMFRRISDPNFCFPCNIFGEFSIRISV